MFVGMMRSGTGTLRKMWKATKEILQLVPAIYILASTVSAGAIWLFINLTKVEIPSWFLQSLQTLFWFLAALLLVTLLSGMALRRSSIMLIKLEKRLDDQLQSVYKSILETETRLNSDIDELYDYIGRVTPKVDKQFAFDTATSLARNIKEDLLKADYSCSKALRRCIFIGTLVSKEDQIEWIRKEIEGYKTLSETPDYRYCEVYDIEGILHDRKMPLQESLSDIESYQHALMSRTFDKTIVTIGASEPRRIIDTVRGMALDFLDSILEPNEYATKPEQMSLERRLAAIERRIEGLQGVATMTSDGRPTLTVPVESINAKEAIAVMLLAVHPTPLSDKELSYLLSKGWKTISPEAVRARASELVREGRLVAEGGEFSLSGAGVQWVMSEVVGRIKSDESAELR